MLPIIDRSVLDAPHYGDGGVRAETLPMPRGALFEICAVAQPKPLVAGLNTAHRVTLNVESADVGWQRR